MSDWNRWVALWRELGAAPANKAVFERLLERYTEPWRAYHTMRHVRDCLRYLDGARHLSQRPDEIELALWFHDTVYDTHRLDNEELSARWAQRHALEQNLSVDVAARVRYLILATKHDVPPPSAEAALMVDIDLAILGQPVSTFDLYEAQIRQEYAWVPEPAFREGRAAILEGFLQRDSIYRTDHFCNRYERQAHLNLKRSLLKLRARPDAP
jgi:predicted metal-dependent HD superfamily phosphohydrolase